MTDLDIIAKSLRARLLSTVITVLLLAVPAAILLVLMTTRAGARSAFERGAGNMHVVISGNTSPVASVLENVFYAGVPQTVIPFEKWTELRQDRRAAFVIPVLQGDSVGGFPTVATTADMFSAPAPAAAVSPVAGDAASPATDSRRRNEPPPPFMPDGQRPFELASGRFFAPGEAGTFDVVLGAVAARGLRKGVGDQLVMAHGAAGETPSHTHDDHPFTVVGVLRPTGTPHDRAVFITLESTWIVHADENRRVAARRGGPAFVEPEAGNLTPAEKPVSSLYVRGRTPVAADGVRRSAEAMGLGGALVGPAVTRLFRIVGGLDPILVGLVVLVALSGAASITLAMYNSMDQRRRQTAVLRVLGASRPRVFAMVLTESAAIGIAGGVLGALLAQGAMAVVARVLLDAAAVAVPFWLDPLDVLLVFCGSVMLACGAGLLPALLAYRTPVVLGLRQAA